VAVGGSGVGESVRVAVGGSGVGEWVAVAGGGNGVAVVELVAVGVSVLGCGWQLHTAAAKSAAPTKRAALVVMVPRSLGSGTIIPVAGRGASAGFRF